MFGVAVSKICRWYNQIQKNNASTNTNFSFRSPVLANNFILQVLWKRTRSVFINIFFFYIFLLWRDWTHVLAESQSSVKHAFMIFLFFLCHKSWRTEKVIDRKYQSGPGRCWTRSEGHHGEKNQKRLICIWPRRCWTRSTWPILSNHVIADGGLILAPLCG